MFSRPALKSLLSLIRRHRHLPTFHHRSTCIAICDVQHILHCAWNKLVTVIAMAFPEALSAYLVTFNCGRLPIETSSLAAFFFKAHPPSAELPEIIAVSLQEVAPIAYSFLGGSYLTPYFDRVVDTLSEAVTTRQRASGHDVLPTYKMLATRNVGMTALMVFVRTDIEDTLVSVQTAGTGVGLWNMGNKGAVGVRIEVQHSSAHVAEYTFIAAHLAPMERKLVRRNQDYEQIVRNLAFTTDQSAQAELANPEDASEAELSLIDNASDSSQSSGLYDTTGYVFVFGDLNYRTSDVQPAPDAYLGYPQPSSPPIEQYLSKDQLNREREAKRTFLGFDEVAITFPPTYKYSEKALLQHSDPPSDAEPDVWHWSRHRFPSWCDRILFLTSRDLIPHSYTALPIQPSSDHRPVALSVTIKPTKSDTPHNSPFPLNPDYASFRASARYREITVGVAAYLALTTEGNIILVGVLAGLFAGVYYLRELL
jgi:hypothetical protein